MAVTVGLMMVEGNAVVVTHVVQLVADPRQQAPAHDHCADGLGVRLPFNLVAFQAPPQDAHIEACIMCHEDSRRHQRLYLLPHLREGRCFKHGLFVYGGKLCVEPVEGLLRIDQREILVYNPAVLYDTDADTGIKGIRIERASDLIEIVAYCGFLKLR